jgi:hypothetical protein
VALRTMLPSTARVGDTIHFAFKHNPLSGTAISGFEVTINGRKIDNPEVVMTRATVGGAAANFVFRASEPGTYQFEVTPIVAGKKGQPRLNTLEVIQ